MESYQRNRRSAWQLPAAAGGARLAGGSGLARQGAGASIHWCWVVRAAAVSRLGCLVEVQFGVPWQGMGAQLAGLRQLHSLHLGLPSSAEAGKLHERELHGLAGLTQLRQLALGYLYGLECQLCAEVAQGMPAHCMVRRHL